MSNQAEVKHSAPIKHMIWIVTTSGSTYDSHFVLSSCRDFVIEELESRKHDRAKARKGTTSSLRLRAQRAKFRYQSASKTIAMITQ